jgi:hypothetical protein
MAAGRNPDGISFRDPPLTGAEIWLTGTLAELHAITAALAEVGAIAYQAPRKPLHGADAGRCRQYIRLTVTSAAPARRGQRPPDGAGAALIDLDAARRRAG